MLLVYERVFIRTGVCTPSSPNGQAQSNEAPRIAHQECTPVGQHPKLEPWVEQYGLLKMVQ